MSRDRLSFEVDTEPMASRIGHVSTALLGVASEVRDMQNAVVDAEKRAADKVCENINLGFLTLVRSQLSQKKVMAEASAGSLLLELRRFAITLRNIRKQMSADFERITSRYAKTFKRLDESLSLRISKLDVHAYDLSVTQSDKIFKRLFNVGVPVLVINTETALISEQLKIASCKNNVVNLSSGMEDFIVRGIKLKEALNGILLPANVDSIRLLYLPLVFFDADDVNFPKNCLQKNIMVGDENVSLASSALESIRRSGYANRASMLWRSPSHNEINVVKEFCYSKISSIKLTSRESDLVRKLINQSTWDVLGGVK